MKRLICLAISAFLLAASVGAQEIYYINVKGALTEISKASFTEDVTKSLSGKIASVGNGVFGKVLSNKKGLMSKRTAMIDGSTAISVLPSSNVRLYMVNNPDIDIADWKLIVLKSKKSDRRFDFAKSSILGESGGINDLTIRIAELSNGIYEISPVGSLEKGEYALVRVTDEEPHEIYDFRVDNYNSGFVSPSYETIVSKIAGASALLGAPGSVAVSQTAVNKGSRKKQSVVKPPVQPTVPIRSGMDNAVATNAVCDVDIDIPQTGKSADETFALIISNENYKQVEPVPFAINDGAVFRSYLINTLGVPERNIIHLKDATLGEMAYAINRLKEIADVYDEPIRIIMHYSGHGIPDESTSEGYILPIDSYGNNPENAYKISDIYLKLGEINTSSTLVFLDACFSGSQRSGNMVASARGVAIKAKQEKPAGNIVAITAAQKDQTAYPFNEKQHGLMTYFVLKKLQETKGDVRLGELADYVIKNVRRESVLTNGKKQEPAVLVSDGNPTWRNIRLIE